MAAFKIHEDMCNYIPTNKIGNKIRPKALKIQNDFKETKRIPLRSTNNVLCKIDIQLNKKENTKSKQVKNEIKAYEGPPEVTLISKENRVNKKIENVEKILHNVEKIDCDTIYYNKSHEKFYFPRDALYLTTMEYHDSIYSYLISLENKLAQPKFTYMDKQPEITQKMRSILVDWLSSVAEEYNMQPQTLHLAVQYVDCFLSRMSVVKAKFQLVGTAAMMIAAKYEEIYPPDTKEWAYLTAGTFTPKQLLKMEQLILKVIQFNIARPTAYSFIIHVCFVCDLPKKLMFLATYFSELAMMEGADYIKYLPSQIASSSLALARHTLQETEVWPKSLENITGYTLKQLSPLIKIQNKTFIDSPIRSQQAIQEKFQTVKYGRVSLFEPREFN